MIEQLTSMIAQRLSWWAAIDILLLAFIFYQILLLIRGTRAAQMVVGIAVLVGGFLVTGAGGPIPLLTVHEVLARILFYVPVAIIVLFQREIRRGLAKFGRNPFARLGRPMIQDQIINPDKTAGIRDSIARGRDTYSMQTIDQHLTELYHAGTITLDTALEAASNPSDFQRALNFE